MNYPIGKLLTARLWHPPFAVEEPVLRHPDIISIGALDTTALKLVVRLSMSIFFKGQMRVRLYQGYLENTLNTINIILRKKRITWRNLRKTKPIKQMKILAKR